MNLQGIPRSFWHSVSFALVTFTIGFMFISYSYGDLTVKFNELEIRTSNATSLEESLNAQALILQTRDETIAEREKEIDELSTMLDKKASELEEVRTELASLQNEIDSNRARDVISKIDNIYKDKKFEERFHAKKEALESLQDKQKIQVQSYDNQRSIYTIQQLQQQQWAK